MSKLIFALSALLLLSQPSAFATEPVEVKELADIATPAQIWAELLANPSQDEINAEPTARINPKNLGSYRLNIIVQKHTGKPDKQTLMVLEDGEYTGEWLVSTGANGYNTPAGIYGVDRIEYEWFSTIYDNAPMHRAIFFNGGQALHATYGAANINGLGIRASHGCIRQHPDNADKLYNLVKKYGRAQTVIIVQD